MDFKNRNMIDKDYKEIIQPIKNIGINFLEGANLLEITVKELLISDLTKNISLDEGLFKKKWTCRKEQIKGIFK